ncbi:hypothetical protein F5B17DRAFT_419232 [Nemania serpens]|nr:hypothetical protein F5B17DRAFT_419232 [Nemania serpens]
MTMWGHIRAFAHAVLFHFHSCLRSNGMICTTTSGKTIARIQLARRTRLDLVSGESLRRLQVWSDPEIRSSKPAGACAQFPDLYIPNHIGGVTDKLSK